MQPSIRAEIITRRTYNRPLDEESEIFEDWFETIDRVIGHQKWLWERALTHKILRDMPLHEVTEDMQEWVQLNNTQLMELEVLREIMLERKALPSGRCFTGDTKVKLLDGTTRRFDELEEGVMYWAYGCREDGEIVPVEALFNGVTRQEYEYTLIKLDNGKEIKCTIDHPFMLVDGSYKEAKDLLPEDSLMPLYTKIDKNGYEMVYNKGKWIKTYKLVKSNMEESFIPPKDQNTIIHHINFNKQDNTPENLLYMGDQEHFALHSALGKENVKKMNALIWNHPDYSEFREKKAIQCSELGRAVWSNKIYEKTRTILKKKASERAAERNKTDKQKEAIKAFRNTEKGNDISLKNLEKANKNNYGLKVKLFKQAKHLISLNLDINKENWNANKLYSNAMGYHVINKYFDSIEIFIEELSLYNHNITSVEIVKSNKLINFYDFSVPKTVNFALDAGIFVHNTLWLGGTDVSKKREASQFNCAHTKIETIYDAVDIFWLLLQGCGVGFTPVKGTLTGFRKPIPNIEIIRSERTEKGGKEYNEEHFRDGIWTIRVGDSAEAWAKSVGKLLAGKHKAHTLVFDFSQIRPEGERLNGYGWISSGDGPISRAYPAIAGILNKRAGGILTKIDILDIGNWLGTVLSSRRSAEIALVEYGSDEWREFASAKINCYSEGYKHRQQSNNSLVFNQKPTRKQLMEVFDMIIKHGGSEPGFINGETARKRAPWFMGVNPCGEILLPNKGFCNLVETAVSKFRDDMSGLFETMPYIARANYRQTCVDFRDGVLQESWHLNNEFLRLCGVSFTGIAQRDDISEYDWKCLNRVATQAAGDMARELGTQRPKNTTTGKPSGTLSKIMGDESSEVWEGIHKPLGRYIFNWVNFGQKDPLVPKLKNAGYRWILHPSEKEGILFCLPIDNGNFFDKVEVKRNDGTVEILEVNKESALDQLERYKKLQLYFCDQNMSNTISYDPSEKDDIVDWVLENWEIYVGVSFLFRNDPTLSAKDLGFEYLPQEVVTKTRYEDYIKILGDIDFDGTDSFEELELDDCSSGVCPVK